MNRRIICGIICAAFSIALLGGCKTSAAADNAENAAASTSAAVNEGEKIVSTISNQNADETTKAIYEYIKSLSDKQVLSAQQESTWMGSPDYEMLYIKGKTGKYPAMRGLDYMNDDFKGVNERAIQWWNDGGLVTICWHTGCHFSGEWSHAMKTEIEDWDAVLTEGTEENKTFVEGMDKAAEALLELQEQGVTVLWRPFHEFDGKWFWWGKGGSENFIKLWQMMYDRYTNHWGLNNLIWVLGYSGNGQDYDKWYPGDEYCDIVGADSYNGGAQGELCDKIKKFVTDKPYCFHECGTNPTAEELAATSWTYFMTWHTEHIVDKNDPEALNTLYNSELVITKDELPEKWIE